MAEIDPELRDKIIQTHTMMEVMVKAHDEQKVIVNARLRDARRELNAHKADTKEVHEKLDVRIEKGEHFRTRIIAYATAAAAGGAIVIELAVIGGKKFLGIA